MLLEIDFDLIFKELSVQDTLKYPSYHLKYLVLKRKKYFHDKNPFGRELLWCLVNPFGHFY